MKTRPNVLICDVGDTLIRWNHYSREAGLQALHALCDHPERFDLSGLVERGQALDDYIEPQAAESRIEYREADFLRLLFGYRGIQLLCDDDNLEWHYWRNALGFTPEPGVASGLQRIADLGVRLAIVSNTAFGPRCISGELQRHGLDRFFQHPIVTSARFGVRKPHPAILESARGLFTSGDETAWYVGNSVYHDVGGANAAQLPVVWYNEDGDRLETLRENGETPDAIVGGWDELAGLIESLPESSTNSVA